MSTEEERAKAWRDNQAAIMRGRAKAGRALLAPPAPRLALLKAWEAVRLYQRQDKGTGNG